MNIIKFKNYDDGLEAAALALDNQLKLEHELTLMYERKSLREAFEESCRIAATLQFMAKKIRALKTSPK